MKYVPNTRTFLLGVVLLGIAIAGQLSLAAGRGATGGILLLIGAGGFAVVFRPKRTVSSSKTSLDSVNWPSWETWLVAVGTAVGVALSLVAWVELDAQMPSSRFWRTNASALALTLAGPLVVIIRIGIATDAHRHRLWTAVLLCTMLAGAAILRLYHLDQLPFGFWYDEAANGLEALRIVHEPEYHPVYTDGVNASGHYLFLVAAALEVFGVSTWSVRVVTALMGIAATGAAYLAARELFDGRIALLAAAMFAVSRWAITFSRLGMYNMATPLFELLTMAFLWRALRRNNTADFAFAGLAVGFGLCFYTAFQLFVPVAGLVLVIGLATNAAEAQNNTRCAVPGVRSHTGAGTRMRVTLESLWRCGWKMRVGLVILIACTFIVIAPVLKFAVERPDLYFARVQGTSLFSDKESAERWPALTASLRKHLLMFNVRGDPNGRHNLPGAPMLDPVTGALFVTGVALCLVRWRKPHHVFLLVWLGMALMGGVFSLDFEAPQSLRSIGALPAALLLAVVPLEALHREWAGGGGKYYPNAALAGLVLLFVPIAATNIDTYFRRQANDFASWNAHSTPETLAARTLNSLAPGTRAYVVSLFDQHPTVRFLTQNWVQYRRLDTTATLPLVVPADADLALILDAERRPLYEEAVRLYPDSEHDELAAPFGSPTVLYSVKIPADQVAAIQGLEGRYFAGEQDGPQPGSAGSDAGAPDVVRRDAGLDFVWPDQAPVPLPFAVEWRGVLAAETYGPYLFGLSAPARAEMYINEHLAISIGDARPEHGAQDDRGDALTGEVALVLPRGKHSLRITAEGGEGRIRLIWRTPDRDTETIPAQALYVYPVTINGLLGRYFPNGDWSGSPSLAQIDTHFDMYFHITPLSRPYTVEWTGKIAAPAPGDYVFELSSVDESSLFIDGMEVAQSSGKGGHGHGVTTLTEGLHDIRIRYADRTDHTRFAVYWTPPAMGGAQRASEVVPTSALFPPQADYAHVKLPTAADLWREIEPGFPSSLVSEEQTAHPEPRAGATLAQAGIVATGLARPAGIATFPDGRVAVALPDEGRVLVFSEDGTQRTELAAGDEASGLSSFAEPFDVDVDSHGTLYVLDSGSGRVSQYDSTLAFVRYLEIEPSYADRARGIGVRPEATASTGGAATSLGSGVWLADTSGGVIAEFDASGVMLRSFAVRNDLAAVGEAQPVDVLEMGDGTVWTTDAGVHKVTLYSVDGMRLRSSDIPAANTRDGSHLAAGPEGYVFMTEPEQRTIARYAADGTQILTYMINVDGGAPVKPVGIDVDAKGNLWVSDVEGGRILRLEIDVER